MMAIPRWFKISALMVFMLLLGAAGGFIYHVASDLPDIRKLEGYSPSQSSIIYSADGKVLAELFYERRTYIPHDRIPPQVKNAFIAIEDQRFYSHPGLDLLGIIRALYKDILAQKVVEGGSTITQQLTKMLFLKPERSITRKIKEAVLSVRIEKHYTKDEILGMYLNQAYFGTRAYGIEAAASTYFGKSVAELSLGETALIAGLQKAPSQYSPFRNAEKARQRRHLVLRNMLGSDFITREEYERANNEPMPSKAFYRRYEAPYFVEILRPQLEEKYGDRIYTGGYRIYSTIDLNLQKAAEVAVAKGVRNIEKRVKPGIQASLIAIDMNTGAVKALVGGTDFWETQFNRSSMAMRQPGSAFKPFIYATALEKGMTDESTIMDSPVSYPGGKPGQPWSPKNYDGKYHGAVSLKTAIALSLNAATVRLANTIGIQDVIDLARRCGIRSEIPPYLSTALGAADVTPMAITAAYIPFATGRRMDLLYYDRITDRDGFVLSEMHPASAEVLSAETVAQMRTLLRAVVEHGTALKAKEIKRSVYGKTGTTNDFSDAWFIGFDDSLVVGVWVGRDNHVPIGPKEAGARSALPIWIDFMQSVSMADYH